MGTVTRCSAFNGVTSYASALVRGCDDSSSVAELRGAVSRSCESLGFEHFIVRGVARSPLGHGADILLTNYPACWLDHYRTLRYREIDPAAAYSRAGVRPASLADLPDLSGRLKLFAAFRKDVSDAGLLDGITVPLRSRSVWGFLNLNGRRSNDLEHVLSTCTILGVAVVEALERLQGGYQTYPGYAKLTLREKQVLLWSLGGKTAWETAMILGITERTVVAHLSSGMHTMGCVNKAQLLGAVSEHLQSDPALAESRVEL